MIIYFSFPACPLPLTTTTLNPFHQNTHCFPPPRPSTVSTGPSTASTGPSTAAVDQDRLNRMYDRATGAQQKANDAVKDITDVMMQIPGMEQTVDGLKGSGGGSDVTLDGVTQQGECWKID